MPLSDRDYMKVPRRRALRVSGLSLGWPYCIIVAALAANWIWDIIYRLTH